MLAPIPAYLLIHSATLKNVTTDMYGDKTYIETPLIKVRFEATKSALYGSNGEDSADKYIMFFDLQNSSPSGTDFKVLDKITFDGEDFTIRTVNKLYDDTCLHHFELALV